MRVPVRVTLATIAAALLAACGEPTRPGAGPGVPGFAQAGQHSVQVAPPAGNPAADFAAIAAAVAAARDGDEIRFAAGTYQLGDNAQRIVVTATRVMLSGHSAGTVIRGANARDQGLLNSRPLAFHLAGGRQTIRNITFEQFGEAVLLGLTSPELGGYIVEQCTFVNSVTPVLAALQATEFSEVRGNTFINSVVPLTVLGHKVRFSDNRMLTPDASQIPTWGQPFFTNQILSAPFGRIWNALGNVIEDNYAEGFPDGTHLTAFFATELAHTQVRRNVHVNQTLYSGGDIGTIAVVQGSGGSNHDNHVTDNVMDGSAGVAVLIFGSRGTRVAHNTLRNVAAAPGGFPGSAVWLFGSAPGTDIIGNAFSGNAHFDVVLESNDNLVVLSESDDTVLDLGANNRINRPANGAAPAPAGLARPQRSGAAFDAVAALAEFGRKAARLP